MTHDRKEARELRPEPRPAGSLRARLSPAGLLAAQSAALVADFALALTPWASALLTAVEALVGVAWVQLLLASGRDPASAHDAREPLPRARRPGGSPAGRARALAAKGVAVLLFAVLLAAKGHILTTFGAASAEYAGAYQSYTVGAFAVFAAGVLGRGDRMTRLFQAAAEHPARLMIMSFGFAGLLGGLLLALPPSLQRTADASLLDAMFVSFSAVCVTGLSTYNVADTLSPFGHAVLLGLIQIGGLGIMALTAALTTLAGGRLRMRSSAVLAEMLDAESRATLIRTLRAIVIVTLVVETIGAGLLYLALRRHPEVALGPASPHPMAGAGSHAWSAVFHAVSAFCNAGFSLSRGGLAPFQGSAAVQVPVMALIVLGGLGFPVLDELRARAWERIRRRRPRRMTLQARVVLATTGTLTVATAVAFFLCERGRTLRDLPAAAQALAALFHSVSLRTAGFNTVDLAAIGAPAVLVSCLAMAIGASPGSTGGGLKTTTAAALFAALRAEVRGEQAPRLFDRVLPPAVSRRAMALAFLYFGWILVTALALLAVGPDRPGALVFEAVSAASTAGLTMGLTAELGPAGKVILILTMFVGRIGPITAALALARSARPPPFSLPEEKIVVG